MVFDVAVLWLLRRQHVRAEEKVAKIKIPFSAFDALNDEDRIEFVVRELDRDLESRAGLNRFEELLHAVGLKWPRNDVLAENIYEMQQIRNVFAHKRGIADAQFVNACPHLDYQVGDVVKIGRDTWLDFTLTTVAYSETLIHRMQGHLGLTVRTSQTPIRRIRYRSRQEPAGPSTAT
jgi:hypothetical protein